MALVTTLKIGDTTFLMLGTRRFINVSDICDIKFNDGPGPCAGAVISLSVGTEIKVGKESIEPFMAMLSEHAARGADEEEAEDDG